MFRRRKNPISVIFLTVFVDMLGYGILIPVIPLLLADPHSQYYLLPKNYSTQTGYIVLGLLTAIYPICQLLAAPILGQLSDKHGRRPLLALSLMGTAISYVLFALGIIWTNIPLLFFSRALDGITGGNIAVAQAAIADISDNKNRVQNFGMIGAAFGLGFIIGPFIGGTFSDPQVLSWFSAATPFWLAAVLSGANALSVYFAFPETHHTRNHQLTIKWHKSVTDLSRAFGIRGMRVLFATSFLLMAGFTFFTTFFGVYLIQHFTFDQGDIGLFFAYIGILSAFTQMVLVRYVSKHLAERTVISAGLFGLAIGIGLYLFAHESWHLFLIAPILACSNGLTMANLTALISKTAKPQIQGEIMGISASVRALAQSIPPLLSGFIAAALRPEAPIVVSCAILLVAAGGFNLLFTKERRSLLKKFIPGL